MFELVSLVISLALIGFLIVETVRLRIKMKRVSVALLQSEINREAIEKKLLEALDSKDSSSLEQTEGFLKFVSQSRDWAFQYIERVQISIKKFQDVFHPFAEQYYENKRTRIPKEEFPAVVEAYRKLVEELPEEGKKK